MYERKIPIDLDCPLRLTMSLIDSKWKSCILDELRYRSMRPSMGRITKRFFNDDGQNGESYLFISSYE